MTLIRSAEPRDLTALGRLGASLMRTHYAFDRQRFLSPDEGAEAGYAAVLGTQLHEDDAVVMVAEIDGAVAGYVYAGVEPLSWKELRDEASCCGRRFPTPARAACSSGRDSGRRWSR